MMHYCMDHHKISIYHSQQGNKILMKPLTSISNKSNSYTQEPFHNPASTSKISRALTTGQNDMYFLRSKIDDSTDRKSVV